MRVFALLGLAAGAVIGYLMAREAFGPPLVEPAPLAFYRDEWAVRERLLDVEGSPHP